MKRQVILSGELAKKFGKLHEFDISTPAEAVRALAANHPEFVGFVASSSERGVAYKVISDGDILPTADDVNRPLSKTLRIVPVITGAKSGFFGVILGVALIAASIFVPGLAAVTFAGTSLASVAFGLGASMVLGGISQMLSPHPKGVGPQEDTKNTPSYTFNGPVNTTQQGQPVPVGYGRLIVGSAVISAGISVDDFSGAGVA